MQAADTSIATAVRLLVSSGSTAWRKASISTQRTIPNAFQVGPAQADPQQQATIEDTIAQGVNALNVVPMSPEALERKARQDKGIAVITHEAASQQNVHYDIEAFKNEDFGANLMEQMAQCMGGGASTPFVGSLTSQTQPVG